MTPPNTTPLNEEDRLGEILTKAFNDFYDYITEKDMIKVAHEYSEKTVYKTAKQELTNLIQTLEKKARIELFNLYGTPVCENLHHPKKYQHKYFENCPVVERIAQLEKGTE